MKNSIRCCISCVLPCGALDVIRIVHTNGRVEEISGLIRASDIMKAHPKHVLKKPSLSSSDSNGVVTVPRIVIVPPEAELQRGKIYFLMPLPPSMASFDHNKTRTRSGGRSRKMRSESGNSNSWGGDSNNVLEGSAGREVSVSDRYLSDILSEKLSTQRDRRRGRAIVWRPHLESISETTCDYVC